MNTILNNGVQMPTLGLGVYKMTESEMDQAIQTAVDAGYRAFDTAYFYFNEEALGKALKKTGLNRSEYFITTKLWNDDQGYNKTKRAFKESLKRLNTDYIDLYLIHWPCPADDLYIETYKAIEELYEEGLIKAIGVCNFKEHHLEHLMKETKIVPVVNQVEFHPVFNQKDLQMYCETHGIKVTAWSPLMRGGELLDNPALVEIAQRYNKTVPQVIIKWHLQQGRIVIPKSKTPSRIKENITVTDFELTEDELIRIDKISTGERQFRDPDEVKIGEM